MQKYDAVIIGAGVAGMSSALLLARRGWRVALLEQGRQLAPLIAGFDRAGAHFETGVHYSSCLGAGEVGRFFFEQLGVEVAARACADDGYDEIRLLPTGRNFKMV
ncbi:MAG: FAD-dependent oxidoreductase, partial [Verrucomicrobiales bacterium]|nr:FAD-dependent oxidoreductase [Verrucomicrobiales bacterium]